MLCLFDLAPSRRPSETRITKTLSSQFVADEFSSVDDEIEALRDWLVDPESSFLLKAYCWAGGMQTLIGLEPFPEHLAKVEAAVDPATITALREDIVIAKAALKNEEGFWNATCIWDEADLRASARGLFMVALMFDLRRTKPIFESHDVFYSDEPYLENVESFLEDLSGELEDLNYLEAEQGDDAEGSTSSDETEATEEEDEDEDNGNSEDDIADFCFFLGYLILLTYPKMLTFPDDEIIAIAASLSRYEVDLEKFLETRTVTFPQDLTVAEAWGRAPKNLAS